MKGDLLSETDYKFVRMFKRGKQGLTGLVVNEKTQESLVFKMSQHIDYLCEHEETIASRLNELKCPVFSKLLHSETMRVNPDAKAAYPFEKCADPIDRRVLFFEYIKGYSLSKLIKSKQEVDLSVILSSVKIILLATRLAYQTMHFTHYDLHTSNILMTKCDRDRHLLIELDSENVFSVPTHGWMPKIIDYGFAYIDKVDEGPMYQSLAHTNVGFMSCAPDPFADAKLFLASVSSHALRYRRAKSVVKLRRIVKSVFGKLSMDFDCGWDVNDDDSIADQALARLTWANERKSGSISELFDRYDHFAVDLLGSLVMLPFDLDSSPSPGYSLDMKNALRVFLKQFSKIESVVLSSFTRMQILKVIVDEARSAMCGYYNPSMREESTCTFTQGVIRKIDAIVRFVDLSSVNFEKILCSLLLFARGLESFLAERLGALLNRKRSEYLSKLGVKNSIEIVGAIELKIGADRSVNESSEWLVIKPFVCSSAWRPAADQLEELDGCHPLVRGTRISKFRHLNK